MHVIAISGSLKAPIQDNFKNYCFRVSLLENVILLSVDGTWRSLRALHKLDSRYEYRVRYLTAPGVDVRSVSDKRRAFSKPESLARTQLEPSRWGLQLSLLNTVSKATASNVQSD